MADELKFFPSPEPESEDGGYQGRKGEAEETRRRPLARITARPSEKRKADVPEEETVSTGRLKKGASFRGFQLLRHISGGKSKDTWVVQSAEGDTQFLKILDSPVMPDRYEREENRASFFRKQETFTKFENFRKRTIEDLRRPTEGAGSLVVPTMIGRTDDDHIFVVTRFLQNQVVDERTRRMKRRGDSTERAEELAVVDVAKWTEWQRLRFIRSLLLGVWMLHRWGIVHGDIKPTNVLVANSPDGPLARVIDIENSFKDMKPFDMTLIGGDEDYFSPERFQYQMDDLEDATQLGLASDVFSLSLTLHKVFSPGGKLPKWTSGKGSAAERAISGAQPMYLGLGTGNKRFEELIVTGLNAEPDDRPSLSELILASGMFL